MLFKHYVLCEGRFETPDAALDPTMRFKMENAGFRAPVKVSSTAEPSATKQIRGPKKKTVPQRKISTAPNIVKAELQLDEIEDDEYANYEEDITYDNYDIDSDSTEAPNSSALEPHVELQEQPAVRIKEERVSDPPTVQDSSHPNIAELIRNIKKEKSVGQAMNIVTPQNQQQKNKLALKIKAERVGTDQSVMKVLNPMAVGAVHTVRKKVFKIPQELQMKIKMEKKDAGYGDRDEAEPDEEDLMPQSPQVNIKAEKMDVAYGDGEESTVQSENCEERRDEAEPEDEDLMGGDTEVPVISIKKEKVDAGYEDSREVVKKPKQFINPMALMMRDKPASNGFPEKSLVISAVTSINSEDSEEMPAATNTEETKEAISTQNCEPNLDPPSEELLEECPKMVQIPKDCLESQVASEGVFGTLDEHPGSMDSNDDLDALLRIYEDSTPPDNDLFQELLKFD